MNASVRLLRWLGIYSTPGPEFKSRAPHRGRIRGFLPVLMVGAMALSAQAQCQFGTEVNADGTLSPVWAATNGTIERWRVDPGFDAGELTGSNAMILGFTVIHATATLPDGRIYIGGHLFSVQGVPRQAIARLLPDGRLDPSFDPGNTLGCTHALFLQENGRLVAGWGEPHRFLPDGSRDPSFASFPDFTEILALLPGGGFLTRSGRLTQDGLKDPSFRTTVDLWNAGPVLVHPDGRMLLVRWDDQGTRLTRLMPDGEVDPAFDPARAFVVGRGGIMSLAALPDGKYLVGGNFTNLSGLTRACLARVTATGAVDPSFDPRDAFADDPAGMGWFGRGDRVLALAPLPDGRVLVGGRFSNPSSTSDRGLVRLNPDGSLDRTFELGAGPSAPATEIERESGFTDTVFVNQIAVQSNGDILLTGDFYRFSGLRRMGIVRLTREEAALWLGVPRRSTDGVIELDVFGTPGLTGTVEAAASLEAADWQTLGPYEVSQGSCVVRDPAAADRERRFYRATAN